MEFIFYQVEMRDFKKLHVWEESHKLVKEIYNLCKYLPKEEKYRTVDQILRASSSIPINIAEGCGRDSDKELKRFLTISNGSASEVEYLLILMYDLNYINLATFNKISAKVHHIRKMNYKLIKVVNSDT